MPFHFQHTYPPEIEAHMRNCFASLSEKDRRRYTAVEAVKLGHGGITYRISHQSVRLQSRAQCARAPRPPSLAV